MKRNREVETILTGIPKDGQSLTTECRLDEKSQRLTCETEIRELDTDKLIRRQKSVFDIDPDN